MNISYGSVEIDYTTYMSPVYYYCDYGFALKGSNYVICEADGEWSPMEAECLPIGKYGKWFEFKSTTCLAVLFHIYWLHCSCTFVVNQ